MEKSFETLESAIYMKDLEKALSALQELGEEVELYTAECIVNVKRLTDKLEDTRILYVANNHSLASERDKLAFIHG
jgi:hypothetical protein